MGLDGGEAATAPFGEGVVVAGDVVGEDYGFGDVVADVLFADQIDDVGFFESFPYSGLDSGKDYVDAFILGGADEGLQVVDGCGVNEGDSAHADDADKGFFFHRGAHHLVEFRCNPKEEWSGDLVYRHPFLHVEDFMGIYFGALGNVEFLAIYLDLSILSDSAQEQQHGEEKTDLNGYRQVEDDGQEHCHKKD